MRNNNERDWVSIEYAEQHTYMYHNDDGDRETALSHHCTSLHITSAHH